MWTFNVARDLLAEAGYRVLPEDVPIGDDGKIEIARRVVTEETGGDVYCFKVHIPLEGTLPASRFIVPYRDIRDAVMSYMRFMRCGFDRGLQVAADIVVLDDFYAAMPADIVLRLRYDGIIDQPLIAVRAIATFLETDIGDARIEAVNDRWTLDKVSALIARVDETVRGAVARHKTPPKGSAIANFDGTWRARDVRTGFQSGHISSIRSGEWRRLLSKEQQSQLNRVAGGWLERNGFAL